MQSLGNNENYNKGRVSVKGRTVKKGHGESLTDIGK